MKKVFTAFHILLMLPRYTHTQISNTTSLTNLWYVFYYNNMLNLKILNFIFLTIVIVSNIEAQDHTKNPDSRKKVEALKFEIATQANKLKLQGTTLLDSAHWATWSPSKNQWIHDERYLYYYESKKLDSTFTINHVSLNNNAWENFNQTTYTFDSNRFLTTIEEVDWYDNLNQYQNDFREEFINDSKGLALYKSIYNWNKNISQWELSFKFINKYNSNSQLVEQIHQTWEKGLNQLVNDVKIVYSYDTIQNTQTRISLFWDASNQQWKNGFKYLYKFDNNNSLIEKEDFSWDDSTDFWKQRDLIKYTYDHHNNIEETTYYEWNNNSWLEYYRYKRNNKYDAENNLIQNFYLEWDVTNQSYVNIYKYDYFYSKHIVNSNKDTKENSNLKISPNPCQDFITINGMTSSSNLSLFDLQSNQIQVKKDNDRIDLSNLNSGIYFLRIRKENENKTFKIIKL